MEDAMEIHHEEETQSMIKTLIRDKLRAEGKKIKKREKRRGPELCLDI